eukprot:COSAG01_NODE_63399_length_280_cov_0.574586_1_plen_89_part_10
MPVTVDDTTSALHYLLFSDNPQFTVLDHNMTVRHNFGSTGTSFVNSDNTFSAAAATMVASLVAGAATLPPQPQPPANNTAIDWIIQAYI